MNRLLLADGDRRLEKRKLRRAKNRRAHHWGKTQGKIGFHGAKVALARPRPRGFDFHPLSADPGLDLANRRGERRRPPGRETGVRGKTHIEFDRNRPCNQPPRPRARDFAARIIAFVFLPERNASFLIHGVTLLLGDFGGLAANPVTPPTPSVTQFPESSPGEPMHIPLSPVLDVEPLVAATRQIQGFSISGAIVRLLKRMALRIPMRAGDD
ncbi:MAG: hypothetical protein ACREDM_01555 [Methylocella sp.]